MEKVYEVMVIENSFWLFGIKKYHTYLFRDRNNAIDKVVEFYKTLLNTKGFDFEYFYINEVKSTEENDDEWANFLLNESDKIPNGNEFHYEYKDNLDSETILPTEIILKETIILD